MEKVYKKHSPYNSIRFKNLNKFSNSAWNKRGLNPSDNDICERLEPGYSTNLQTV